jgi:cytochrome P450
VAVASDLGMVAELAPVALNLVVAKRAEPGEDLASVLANGNIPELEWLGQIDVNARAANMTLLFITGLEQPRNTVASGLLTFAQHPDQWHLLRADRTLRQTAIEELLRWVPPNPYNRRTATTDLTLNGNTIHAGDKVTLWWPSANRDETVFTNPDSFEIQRYPNPHLSFGAGQHHCLGQEFAGLQTRCFLDVWLGRVDEIRQTGPVTFAPNNKHTVPLTAPVELSSAR